MIPEVIIVELEFLKFAWLKFQPFEEADQASTSEKVAAQIQNFESFGFANGES